MCIRILIANFSKRLITKDRYEKAEKSLKFYRTKESDISTEIGEIQSKHQEVKDSANKSWNWTLSRIFSMAFFKPFCCIGIIPPLSMMSYGATTKYIVQFVEESGTDIDPMVGPMALGIMRIAISGIVPYIIQRMQPRKSYVIAHFIIGLSMASMATFYYINSNKDNLPIASLVPLAMIMLINVMLGLATVPIEYALVGELFPTEIRAVSIGICKSVENACAAMMVKIYPDMKAALGMFGICYVYASIGMLATIWAYFTIPDNRSKTLVEIEKSYDTKNSVVNVMNTTTTVAEDITMKKK